MEYLVLNSYLQLKKRNKVKFIEWFKQLSVAHKIAFVLMVVTTIVAIVLNWNNETVPAIIVMSVELLVVLYVNKSKNKLDFDKSAQKIVQKDEDYEKLKKWLEEIKFGEKNQIRQLCNRCEKIIQNKENEKEKAEKRVDKLFAVFIFPVWIAVITWILGLDGGTVGEHIKVVVTLAIFIGIIYLFVMYCVSEIDIIGDSLKYDMQSMVNDLHGILDRKFKIEESDII